MSPFPLLFASSRPGFRPNALTGREARASHRERRTSMRMGKKKEMPRLPSPSLPCIFYPEEEVFSLSLERREEEGHLPSLPPTPPPMEEEEGAEVVTPEMGPTITCPTTPRRESRVARPKFVHAYQCEDVLEYAVDVFGWKRELEARYLPGDWTRVQTDVTPGLRCALLVWLAGVTRRVEMVLETWCLAVNYLDRFLGRQPLAAECLQLAGLSCLWIAAKQEEGEPPGAQELVNLCGGTYSTAEFRHMEVIILARLGFQLAAPTPAFLLAHMVEVGEERDWPEDFCRHLVERTLQDHELALISPSRVAHAIFTILKTADPSTLRLVESGCPECEPANSSEECRRLLHSAGLRVAAILLA